MSKNIIVYYNIEDQLKNIWTPSRELSSFEAWYDASDSTSITESSGSVSQWDDKTGNGHHLTQGTASTQPTTGTRTIGNLNVIDLDGAGTGAGGDQFSITDPWDFIGKELHVIGSVDNHTTNNKIFGNTSSNGQQAAITPSGQENMRMWQGGSNPWSADSRGAVITAGENYLWGFLYRNTVGTFKTYVANGTITNTTDTYISGTMKSSHVGRGQFSPTYDGVLGEMIITKGLLSDGDRQVIEGYLVWKWGLVSKLPSSHPYKNSPPL